MVFLNHIVATYRHFLQVLTPLDLAKLTSLMLDSLSKDCCPNSLLVAKLGAIQGCVSSPVWECGEARGLLLPTCCHHVKAHLLQREELEGCAAVLGDILTFLQERIADDRGEGSHKGEVVRDVQTLAEILLDPIVTTLLVMDRDTLSITMVKVSISMLILVALLLRKSLWTSNL